MGTSRQNPLKKKKKSNLLTYIADYLRNKNTPDKDLNKANETITFEKKTVQLATQKGIPLEELVLEFAQYFLEGTTELERAKKYSQTNSILKIMMNSKIFFLHKKKSRKTLQTENILSTSEMNILPIASINYSKKGSSTKPSILLMKSNMSTIIFL